MSAVLEPEVTSEEIQESPPSLLQATLSKDILGHIGKFVSFRDFKESATTSRYFHTAFKVEMSNKKKVSQELLPHVFNADPKAVEEFFAKGESERLVLTRTCFREGYHSKTKKEFICFRRWKSVSPLQAAALCGDNFLVIKLLSYIENDIMLRREAIQQLQEVLNRKAKIKPPKHAQAAETPVANGETKVNAEEIEIADGEEYLAPYYALCESYVSFINERRRLLGPAIAAKWREFIPLWGSVGEIQKRLPTYGLQVFFSPTAFLPLPDFNKEPLRECRYQDNTLFELDSIGRRSQRAVFKGSCQYAVLGNYFLKNSGTKMVVADSDIIYHLAKTCREQLISIISRLEMSLKPLVLTKNGNSKARKL